MILDWVPAHFPRDDWALALLRRHASLRARRPAPRRAPRLGHARLQLRPQRGAELPARERALLAREYHADGIRVDAVASMLYLDYSRKAGEWIPNVFGGRENLEAVPFLKELNEVAVRARPRRHLRRGGVDGVAGRLAPDVPRRARLRLQVEHGVDARHARLLREGPGHRSYHHHTLTFAPMYAFTRELHPAALARRGRARQALAARQDARRPLAEVREPARALRVHVGAPRARSCSSWAASSASGTSGTTTARCTGTCSSTPSTRACSRSCATSTALPRDARAVAGRLRAGRLPLARGERRSEQRVRVRAVRRGGRAPARLRAEPSPVPREDYRIGMPAGRPLARAPQHRRRALRRLRRRQPRRRRGRDVPWHDQPYSALLTLPPLGAVWLVPE